MTCGSAPCKRLVTVLLSGIYGRYGMHILLYRSFNIPWTEWPGMLESDGMTKALSRLPFQNGDNWA